MDRNRQMQQPYNLESWREVCNLGIWPMAQRWVHLSKVNKRQHLKRMVSMRLTAKMKKSVLTEYLMILINCLLMKVQEAFGGKMLLQDKSGKRQYWKMIR